MFGDAPWRVSFPPAKIGEGERAKRLPVAAAHRPQVMIDPIPQRTAPAHQRACRNEEFFCRRTFGLTSRPARAYVKRQSAKRVVRRSTFLHGRSLRGKEAMASVMSDQSHGANHRFINNMSGIGNRHCHMAQAPNSKGGVLIAGEQ